MTKEKKAVTKPTSIFEATYKRTVWCVTPPSDVEPKDLLESDYWAHVAKRFTAGDRIEAVPEDRHYFAEFFVLAAATNWAKVVLLREETLIKDNETSVTDGYSIGFAGPHKWRVTMGSDVLSKGHDDRGSAAKWLEEHLKVVK